MWDHFGGGRPCRCMGVEKQKVRVEGSFHNGGAPAGVVEKWRVSRGKLNSQHRGGLGIDRNVRFVGVGGGHTSQLGGLHPRGG